MMHVQQLELRPVARAPRAAGDLAATRLMNSRFLTNEERQALADAVSSPKVVKPGIDLLHEGERAESLFILLDGWAARYLTTREGARQLPALLVPGDIANLDSLVLDRPGHGVKCLTEVTLVTLPRERAFALSVQHPGIAQTFTWLAVVENAMLGKLALSLGRRSARERIAHLLCELSVRLRAETGNTSSFAFPATQEHLGDALGLTAVHVNRTLQQLREEGLVLTAHRMMQLPDVARLRQIGGFEPSYLHL